MSKNNATPPPFNPQPNKLQKLKKLLRERALSLLSVCMVVGSLGYLVHKTPDIHRLFLNLKVGSKVYMIKATPNSGGGTGWAVKAPSGTSYIITNSHVCDYLQQVDPSNTALVVGENETMRRRIIENSDFTDLCLIEGLPGVEGLSIGSEPALQETLYAVGHPRLRPLTITEGSVVGREDAQILYGVIEVDGQSTGFTNKCDLPKQSIVDLDVDGLFGPMHVKLCITTTKGAYLSGITIYPGSSGSPVVDDWGRVVGVAFAADSTNWAAIVSRSDLLKFINNY